MSKMIVTKEDGQVPIKSWTDGVLFEESAKEQVRQLAKMPFIFRHVAIMPDVHMGIGATVGSVVATHGAIIPACVGVDLGCGMMAVRTSLTASDLPDSLAPMRSAIESAIPHGRSDHGQSKDVGAWRYRQQPRAIDDAWQILKAGRTYWDEKHPKAVHNRADVQLCSLGTGNHFVEVCLDEEQRVWAMLHSGSRGQGGAIGKYFIELAKNEMKRWFVNLPDVNLAYLPEGSQQFEDYLTAVSWAQEYARVNRELMMSQAIGAMSETLGRPVTHDGEATNCHHNYVSREHHFNRNVIVTRKGAIRAREGDLGIIPGSMGARSFIVRGKGNAESFHSCSHGAGRKMSRTTARKTFTVEDHVAATAGVECLKDESVLDETPAAYKDIDAVMAAQADLVDIVHTLKQVLCVKGGDS